MNVVNKEAFYKLLQNPAHISPDGLESLEELVRVFPFCSLAHTLIAKSHYDQATMLASQKLRKAAAYAVNRSKLKKIITGNWPKPEQELGPPTLASPLVDRPVTFEVQPEAEAVDAPPAGVVTELPQPEAPVAQEEELPFELPKELAFERLVAPLKKPVVPAAEEAGEEPEEPPLLLGHLNEDDLPIEKFSRRTRKHIQREIIESFIRSEPRISSLNIAEKESYTNRDLSERSTQPVEIISENMANIYIRQRKYNKAIQMFEKLILKYPEKKENFAKRIEELKQL